MNDIVDAVDEAYRIYEANDFKMPLRTSVMQDENALMLMPCLTEQAFGTKLLTIFPENTNFPVIQGLVILNDSNTGEMKAILDGTFVTGIRTGAVGGSAVRHLAKESASKIAIIGTGVQGLYQAAAAYSQRPISEIYLHNRSQEKIPAFINELKEWVGDEVNIHSTNTVDEAVGQADIVITATSSTEPVLPNDKELLKNKLIIGIGSYQPSMQEFSKAVYELADCIYVDTEHAVEESGDLVIPLQNGWIESSAIQRMSTIVSGRKKPETESTAVFKSVGMALFDVVVANAIYKIAVDKEVGTKLM